MFYFVLLNLINYITFTAVWLPFCQANDSAQKCQSYSKKVNSLIGTRLSAKTRTPLYRFSFQIAIYFPSNTTQRSHTLYILDMPHLFTHHQPLCIKYRQHTHTRSPFGRCVHQRRPRHPAITAFLTTQQQSETPAMPCPHRPRYLVVFVFVKRHRFRCGRCCPSLSAHVSLMNCNILFDILGSAMPAGRLYGLLAACCSFQCRQPHRTPVRMPTSNI